EPRAGHDRQRPRRRADGRRDLLVRLPAARERRCAVRRGGTAGGARSGDLGTLGSFAALDQCLPVRLDAPADPFQERGVLRPQQARPTGLVVVPAPNGVAPERWTRVFMYASLS